MSDPVYPTFLNWINPLHPGAIGGPTSFPRPPALGRPYYNTVIDADGNQTQTIIGHGNVVGPGTLYPLPAIASLDEVWRYYWRARKCALASMTLANAGTTISFGGSYPKQPYQINGKPAPWPWHLRAGGFGTGNTGIFPPTDLSKIIATIPNAVPEDLLAGKLTPIDVSGPCGETTTYVIGVGPGGTLIYYVIPSFAPQLNIFMAPDGGAAPILYQPGLGYYLPCYIPGASPSLGAQNPPSINPQEMTTTLTDFTTLDNDGNPLVTTTSAWPVSSFTWTLDGMGAVSGGAGAACFDVGTISEGTSDDSITIPGVTYSGHFEFQTFDQS